MNDIIPLAGLSASVWAIVEYLVKPMFNEKVDENGNPVASIKPEYEKWKWVIPYIAGILSVGICTYYGIDEFSTIIGEGKTVVGAILTGLLVVAGSTALNLGKKAATEKVKELKANNEE